MLLRLAGFIIQGLLPPATKLGQGYIFTGVCDSVHGGGGSASVHAGIPSPRHQAPSLHSACWEIRSTCGWYASYWNAILVHHVPFHITEGRSLQVCFCFRGKSPMLLLLVARRESPWWLFLPLCPKILGRWRGPTNILSVSAV